MFLYRFKGTGEHVTVTGEATKPIALECTCP